MPINLTISADSVQEFDSLLARFAAPATGGPMPELNTSTSAGAVAAATTEGKAGKGKKAAASAPAAAGTGGSTTAEDAAEGSGQGQTENGSSSSVDVFATGATSATPSASSPADAAAAEAGEVTIQQLKDAMADLLKAKSASFAMQTLEAATGCKSLTSGSPSVVEKAKDDPMIFRVTLDALIAAKTAA